MEKIETIIPQKYTPVFLIFEGITNLTSKDFVNWIIEQNCLKKPPKNLFIIINSDGGDVSDSFSIVDMMNASNIPVITIGTGFVASGALLIFMNGDTRILTPNTSIMSHTFSGASDGKFQDLVAAQKDHNLVHNRMLVQYEKCTKLSKKDIENKLLTPQDIYLTPEEALKYNICDSIEDIRLDMMQ